MCLLSEHRHQLRKKGQLISESEVTMITADLPAARDDVTMLLRARHGNWLKCLVACRLLANWIASQQVQQTMRHSALVVVNDESKHSTFSRINIVICFIPCSGPTVICFIPCGGPTGRAS
ncbi:hypothetical protein J6590_062123 [Homalodisca vitripennis]|nr:hypothetical protein J6590_062123 [Homalodisca vitripennis]